MLIYKSNIYPEIPDHLGMGEVLNEDNLTEAEEFERLEQMAAVAVNPGEPYKIVNRELFHSTWLVHENLRNCLVYNNGNPCYDLQLIKDFRNCQLRVDRMKPLDDLDAQFMKAMETGSPTEAIVAEKQRLRDITKLADTCTTTQQLRELTC